MPGVDGDGHALGGANHELTLLLLTPLLPEHAEFDEAQWARLATRIPALIALATGSVVLSLALAWTGLGRQFDNYAYDFLFRLEQPAPWQPGSVILAIDEATLADVQTHCRAAELSQRKWPEQVEIVKDRMTYNKVKVTYDAYCAIVPNLTESDKSKISELLKAAREEAIDGGSAHDGIGKTCHGDFGNPAAGCGEASTGYGDAGGAARASRRYFLRTRIAGQPA